MTEAATLPNYAMVTALDFVGRELWTSTWAVTSARKSACVIADFLN